MSAPVTFQDSAARRSTKGPVSFAVLILGVLAMLAAPTILAVVSDPDVGLGALGLVAQLFCNPCVLVVLGFLGFTIYKSRQIPTIVVLEDEHLRVPANGTRAVYTLDLDEGYRYSPKKGVLTVRVPYDRITEVRRPSLAEQAEIGQRGPHRTVSLNRVVQKVRGQRLDAEGAPVILDEELKGGWVSDPRRAVAVHLARVARHDQHYTMFPEVLEDVVLYVSVDAPDALVEALTARIVGLSSSEARSVPRPTPGSAPRH